MAIPAEFAAHRDEVRVGETVLYTFPTGEVAKKIFSGGADASVTLRLVSSQLTFDSRNDFPLPFFTTTSHFSISCVMERGGRKSALSAAAVGETQVDVGLAMRMAVERALADLARQVAALE